MRTAEEKWRSDMGVEPTQDETIAPQTVLKTAVVTGPRAAPRLILPCAGRRVIRNTATGGGQRPDEQRPHSSGDP